MPESFKPCIVVPFYDHQLAIGRTVDRLRGCGLPCWLVDDGSSAEAQTVLYDIAAAESGWLQLLHLSPNQGKGVAVMAGAAAAIAAGYTHAVQVDADGQHDIDDIPHLLQLARDQPAALVTGVPIYDESVPRSRLYGRYLTHFWVWIHTLSFSIRDSMCGFRVYPLAATLAVWDAGGVGRRMDFDTAIMVRLYWRGARVVQMPTRVSYPLDGVSHFDLLRDNLRISWMHTRLFFGMLPRLPGLLLKRLGAS
ncbi:MAG: glycosyltransferase family 2 protein [Hydrocarboniphaga sp.]|uniref:glycosyltransferase family 2 protein n=1 Tax=Hydrocarboniphaga sp. TaxID=2033016 RepID=UPI0026292511|nr:glycosyltransferase family 2 protein [Hydrocarboniphaga sp.]MDB5969861.1 glycosyltransferase family 2 protein [Hydrocarboniphaga sp.]